MAKKAPIPSNHRLKCWGISCLHQNPMTKCTCKTLQGQAVASVHKSNNCHRGEQCRPLQRQVTHLAHQPHTLGSWVSLPALCCSLCFIGCLTACEPWAPGSTLLLLLERCLELCGELAVWAVAALKCKELPLLGYAAGVLAPGLAHPPDGALGLHAVH
eukprot:515619-Pelagomonas_calceolata.AAC.1